jgi:hypothetical protein
MECPIGFFRSQLNSVNLSLSDRIVKEEDAAYELEPKVREPVWLIVITCWACLPSLQAQRVPVVEKELANGMRLLLVERHDEPTVAGGWVAHVGSSNERPGMTVLRICLST